MKQIFTGKLGVLLPLVLGAVAALLAWQYLKHQETMLGLRVQPVSVVVATGDIPRMTKIQPGMVKLIDIPRTFAQPEAITKVEDVYDQVTLVPIMTGEQMLATKLSGFGVETGLAIKVPRGLRAVSVPVNAVSGVANLIRPGDHVDVLVTVDLGNKDRADKRTYTMLSDVLVLAVDQFLGKESEAIAKSKAITARDDGDRERGGRRGRDSANTVTLALPPDPTREVVLALESGAVSLTLRSMFEGHQKTPEGPSTLKSTLKIEQPVMQKAVPAWQEIRGTYRSY